MSDPWDIKPESFEGKASRFLIARFRKKKYLEFNEKHQIWNVEWKTTKTEQIRRPALRFLMLALVDVKMERCWDKQRLGAEVRAARTKSDVDRDVADEF